MTDDRKLYLPFEGDMQEEMNELQELAMKDMLSGLLSRGATEHLIRERLESMETGETCAFFLVDLDDFKRVNDTLGHQAGDLAIQRSAQILSGLFRGSDIVGRLGGDEFVVFLSGRITEKFVKEKAEAICEDVHLVLGDRRMVNLTASVGIYIAGKGQIFENMYHSADLALYKAKKAGKHRYCIKNGDDCHDEINFSERPVNFIQFSELLENMGSGVALLEMSENPKVIYVSPSFCRIIGEEPDTFTLPKPLTELIHPDDIEGLKEILKSGIPAGEIIEHTHRVSVKNGTEWFWWHVWAVQIDYDSKYPVMLITTVDISRFKEKEELQTEKITLLQSALEQTTKRIWDVDILKAEFRAYTSDGKYNVVGDRVLKFPEELIETGQIHPNSAEMFRTFAKDLMGGLSQGFGNFAVRMTGEEYYGWATISYRMIYDKNGRAVRAVGVLEELPQGFGEMGINALEYHRLPDSLASDLIVRMHGNLELDTVEMLWVEGKDMSGRVNGKKCSEILTSEWEKVFRIGDRRDLKAFFSREHFLDDFRDGKRWLCAEYRRADSGGSVRWVRHVVHMVEDPLTRQVHIFFYLVWLDSERKLEPHIIGRNGRDSVSRLFDRTTIGRIAASMFRESSRCSRAVAIFRAAGIHKEMNPERDAEDRVRHELVIALSLALGRNCVLGQYDENHIVILFPEVHSKSDLRHRLEESVNFLHNVLRADEIYSAVRFIIGVSVKTSDTAKYDTMLTQALQTCLLKLDATSDTVTFNQEAEEAGWLQLTSQDEVNQTAVHTGESLRPLSAEEKDVAIECMTLMLTSKTLETSLNGVLKAIGGYYQADRVYTMMLTENGSAVVMTFEWTRPSKHSIQQVVSGMGIDRFPLLKRCRSERAPVFITRKSITEGEKKISETAWGFTAFPLIRTSEVDGFLCIENARVHPTETALPGMLIPFLLKERGRFNGESPVDGTIRRLMDRPDRQTYLEAVHVLNSEYLSSLGAVCVDILGLEDRVVAEFDKESKVLWYVVKTLTEMFDSSMLFRIWENEFVAFLPNTTREIFYARYDRLSAIINRRYPSHVRLGCAWADDVFTGRRLMRKARSAMRTGEYLPVTDSRRIIERASSALRGEIESADQCFTVYFQPKIDMRTGNLLGTEALVRGIDEDGEIIMPAQFIEYLEEEGLVRNLDLIVMERCLSQIEAWKNAGFGLIPVAVNISRITLAHPSTLASVLAVQSHYPDLPADVIELEITERSDGMDNEDFKKIIKQYHDCGLRLTLDDFGSQYANLPLFAGAKFDGIKLDKSLITEVTTNPISRTLIKDIVQICDSYDIDCIAEGVESEEQIDTLLEIGCICGQGYYYDKPLPVEEFTNKYLHVTEDYNGQEESI